MIDQRPARQVEHALCKDRVSRIGEGVAERLESLRTGLHEMEERWNNWLARNERMSAEQYLEGRFDVVRDLAVTGGISKCNIRSRIAYKSVSSHESSTSHATGNGAVNDSGTTNTEQEHVMFVPVAQFVQSNEYVISPVRNISVRSYLVSKQPCGLGDGWTYRSLVDGGFKALNVVRNGQRALLRITRVSSAHQAHPSEVERSAQIAAYVSGHQQEVHWDRLSKVDFERISPCSSISFEGNAMRLVAQPTLNEVCKVLDVMICPHDLQGCILKR